jgi:hypothetical protein
MLVETTCMRLDTLGLDIVGTPSDDEWLEMGRRLAGVQDALQWAIGDWYNQVPLVDKRDACRRVGLPYVRALVYSRVCGAFPVEHRDPRCDFAAYQAAVRMPERDRFELMRLARSQRWTAKKVADAVKVRRGETEEAAPRPQPPKASAQDDLDGGWARMDLAAGWSRLDKAWVRLRMERARLEKAWQELYDAEAKMLRGDDE